MEYLYGFLSAKNTEVVDFQCYPNPFSNTLTIRFNSVTNIAKEIGIYDIYGKKVFSQSLSINKDSLETTIHPSLTAGVYFMKLVDRVIKIVRQ